MKTKVFTAVVSKLDSKPCLPHLTVTCWVKGKAHEIINETFAGKKEIKYWLQFFPGVEVTEL